MATGQIQSKETLLAAFSEGKFPTAQDWANLIETIHAQKTESQIFSMHLLGYTTTTRIGATSNSDSKFTANILVNQIGNITLHDSLVNISSCMSSKFQTIQKSTTIDASSYSAIEPYILIVHNDNSHRVFIEWSAAADGQQMLEQYAENAFDTRYFELDTQQGIYVPKPQLVVIPSGCCAAFSYTTLGGYQPIGNAISYDYDTFLSEQSSN